MMDSNGSSDPVEMRKREFIEVMSGIGLPPNRRLHAQSGSGGDPLEIARLTEPGA
jgi:hypothetical protein